MIRKKSLQKVCKKFSRRRLCRLMQTFEKVCTGLPPDDGLHQCVKLRCRGFDSDYRATLLLGTGTLVVRTPAGECFAYGHTDPDPGDGPQAARRPESRREPAAPVLALQVRWTAPAMHGGADGLTLPAASGRRGPCTSIFQSSHTGFEWAA